MKKFKYILGCLLLGSLAIGFQACKKNPELAVKDVVFTDSVKSYTVSFYNTTTDAKSVQPKPVLCIPIKQKVNT